MNLQVFQTLKLRLNALLGLYGVFLMHHTAGLLPVGIAAPFRTDQLLGVSQDLICKIFIIYFRSHRKPDFSEALRAARLRVERAMEQGEKKVLLVSSAIPGEGKTTISVNLAISLARRGKRVLLIDCDLRSPSVAKALRVKTKHSLVDYLTGKMMLRELLCPTETENLFIIPGGPGGGKVTDLLTRERGSSMIQAARKLFDFVILDTPPCSMLADAAEVAALADAGLLVVRQDYASRDQIIDGVQRLSDAELPMIGWVFNYVERSLPTGSSYGYGAVYGYGKKGR